MIKKIYTCFDEKARCHTRPFFYSEHGEAIRAFSDCANDPKHEIGRHPSDYTLKEIGTFDESTGIITPNPSPISHGTAVEFILPTHPVDIDLANQPVLLDSVK